MQFSFFVTFFLILKIMAYHRYAHTCTHTWYTHANRHAGATQQFPGNTELWKASSTLLSLRADAPCVSETFRPSCFLLARGLVPAWTLFRRRSHYRAVILTACINIYSLSASNLGVEVSTVEFFHLFKNVSKWPHMHIQEKERKVSGKKGPSTYALHKLMITNSNPRFRRPRVVKGIK